MNKLEQTELTIPAAWANIVRVVRAFTADAQTHEILRDSLAVIKQRVERCNELEKAVEKTEVQE
jgi:hypothetical protein